MIYKKHQLFIILHTLIFIVVLTVFGFYASVPLSIFFSIALIILNYRKFGFYNSITFGIIYLLIFDSEIYTYTALDLRAWYPLVLINISYLCIHFMQRKHNNISSIFYYFILFYFLVFSLGFLAIEDVVTKLHIIKYWLFSVGLIVVLVCFFMRMLKSERELLSYLLSISYIVALWGGIQYFTAFLIGMSNNYKAPLGNNEMRPAAFFSETTWFGEYMAFSVILLLLSQTKFKFSSLSLLLLFLFGVLISLTRNAFLVIGIIVLLQILFSLLSQKFKIRYLILLIGISISIPFGIQSLEPARIMLLRFSNTFSSDNSRYQAFISSWELIENTWFLGSGFYWDLSMVTSEGTAFGAKSFNIFLMTFHIFGLVGLILFLVSLFIYYSKLFISFYSKRRLTSVNSKYAIIYLTCFLGVSMTAPLHQFPIGMYFLAMSIYLSKSRHSNYHEKGY